MFGKKTLAITLAAIMILGAAGAAYSVRGGSGWDCGLGNCPVKKLVMGHIGRLLVLKSELDVTDVQKDKIRSIVKSNLPEMAPAIKEAMIGRKALREAVMKKNASEKEIRAAAQQLGAKIGDAAVKASKVVAEVRPVMTPEQVKLIEEFKEDTERRTFKLLDDLSKK